MKTKISKSTLKRYPIYLKVLQRLKKEGIDRIMSSELANYVSIKSSTIRRDFSLMGSLGKQGYGYDVSSLIEVFSNELGINYDEKIILVGAGNFGRAMLNYNHWDDSVGEIECAFDLKPENVKNLSVPCFNIKDINEKKPKNCKIALLCISKDVQETVDLLISAGITGFIDLTHEHFSVPNNIIVKHVDIVSEIQELVFEINNLNK